jgi:hypothetical protein
MALKRATCLANGSADSTPGAAASGSSGPAAANSSKPDAAPTIRRLTGDGQVIEDPELGDKKAGWSGGAARERKKAGANCAGLLVQASKPAPVPRWRVT